MVHRKAFLTRISRHSRTPFVLPLVLLSPERTLRHTNEQGCIALAAGMHFCLCYVTLTFVDGGGFEADLREKSCEGSVTVRLLLGKESASMIMYLRASPSRFTSLSASPVAFAPYNSAPTNTTLARRIASHMNLHWHTMRCKILLLIMHCHCTYSSFVSISILGERALSISDHLFLFKNFYERPDALFTDVTLYSSRTIVTFFSFISCLT